MNLEELGKEIKSVAIATGLYEEYKAKIYYLILNITSILNIFFRRESHKFNWKEASLSITSVRDPWSPRRSSYGR